MVHWLVNHVRDFAIEEIAKRVFEATKEWASAALAERFQQWSQILLSPLVEPLVKRSAAVVKIVGVSLVVGTLLFFAVRVPRAVQQSR